MIVLVHHGEAVDPRVDAQRPLTTAGRETAARLAEAARARGVAPAEVWHSGKLRARQTADVFRRVCCPLAPARMVRGLLPADPSDIMATELAGETRTLLLVGHQPHIARLLRRLLGRVGADLAFPPHGVVAVTSNDAGVTWRQAWRLEAGEG